MYGVGLEARFRRGCHVEGMSIREASRRFGVDRRTVAKMLAYSVPPGYRRSKPRACAPPLRRSRGREGELGTHGAAPLSKRLSATVRPQSVSRAMTKWLNDCITAITSMRLTLTWGGRVATKYTVSAISSPLIAVTP